MATGRQALAGVVSVVAIGCVAPTAERAPSAEPERTYVGQHDERPLLTRTPAQAAPPASCPAEAGDTAGAELAKLSLFSRTLFYLRESFPRDITPRSRELLLASLSAIGAAEREVEVERDPETPPRWVTVTVKGEHCTLNVERVDAPWSLRSSLQDGMRFIGSHLKLPDSETEARFTKIEIAATNGMLSALDPGSVLMDVDAYRDIRGQWPGLSAKASVVAPAAEDDKSTASPAATAPLDEEIAYLRPGAFGKGASVQVEQALTGTRGDMPKGIVLDLRDNSGGLLDEAAKVADDFIQRGVLGWNVGKHERTALEAHDSGHEFSGAVIVLVNRTTTEAAELVASAIKDLGRGLVLGEPSGGAGSVRAVFELARTWRPAPSSAPLGSPDRDTVQNALDGEDARAPRQEAQPDPTGADQPPNMLGLLLRTGYLRTPNDVEIEGAGVRPDVRLPWPAGRASNDDCLARLARAVIDQARDPGRFALLATAKALANKQVCERAP